MADKGEFGVISSVEPDRLATAGSDTQLNSEIARQLRGRLVLVCCIVVATVCIGIAFAIARTDSRLPWGTRDAAFAWVALIIFAVPLLYLLWTRARLELKRLRVLELYVFSCCVFFLAVGQIRWFRSGWLPTVSDPYIEARMFELAADSMSQPWFFLIVFYGTCIPNTGKRCAVVVLGMAAVALAVLAVLAVWHGPVGLVLFKQAWSKMIFWLSIGVAIAIFGSGKLNTLSRQALQARKLGRYVLKRKLGAGGMGEVFLAEQPMLRRPCALKIIRPEKAGDAKNLSRFMREVQAMASLNGPNAVDIFDYGQTEDGTFYYVMEYLSGMNLQELVDRFGPMPSKRAIHVLKQVCRALQEAHQIGLIHRDVKPSNIFLCRRGLQCDLAKLVDFGLVYEAHRSDHEHLTQTGIVVGSPLYLSPEQLRGVEELDARCDLYSLGLVAYVLLTGQHPFKRANVQAIFAAHLTEIAVPISELCTEVAPDLEVIVMRCLEKDPNMRYDNVRSLEAALDSCVSSGKWSIQQAEEWWRSHAPQTLAPGRAS